MLRSTKDSRYYILMVIMRPAGCLRYLTRGFPGVEIVFSERVMLARHILCPEEDCNYTDP